MKRITITPYSKCPYCKHINIYKRSYCLHVIQIDEALETLRQKKILTWLYKK